MCFDPLFCGNRLLHLSTEPLGDLGVRNVIYLVRASIENAKQIAEQIKETNRSARFLETHLHMSVAHFKHISVPRQISLLSGINFAWPTG